MDLRSLWLENSTICYILTQTEIPHLTVMFSRECKHFSRCLRADRYSRQYFIGCFPADMLPSCDLFPYCFVGNLDCHWSKGSHWVVVYVKCADEAVYFDSLGRSPTREYQNYLLKFANVHVNVKPCKTRSVMCLVSFASIW